MERLTYRLTDQCDHPTDSIILKPYLRYEEPETRKKILNRLAAYEDTGLEPDEIYEVRFLIAAQRDPQKLARLRELVLADQEGRLVVLPCKVGDTVFRVFTVGTREPVIKEVVIKTAGEAADLIGRIGKKNMLVSVFRTREEAEAALAGKGGEG